MTSPRFVCVGCAEDYVRTWAHEGAHWPRDHEPSWGPGTCLRCGTEAIVTGADEFGGHPELWDRMPV